MCIRDSIDDIRGSPAVEIIDGLKKMGANIIIYDPYIPEKSNVGTLESALNKAKCIVITAAHSEFKQLSANKLKKEGILVVVDGRNCLNKKEIMDAGIIYKGIGQ